VRTRSANHEDYVLRLIRQAADALRRFRLRLAGADHAPAAVRHDAAAAVQALLGADAPLLARLDAASAARLVGDPQRVALWHGLLDVEAAAAHAEGDVGGAAAGRERAAALRAAAGALWPDQAVTS
jgi:hypothetical protein